MATWTGLPLLMPDTVTDALREPSARLVNPVTVNCVAVAEVTVPVAPPMKVTMLLAGVVEKPMPLIVMLMSVSRMLAVLGVTTGMTVATWTGLPLLTPLTVTEALRGPTTRPVNPVTVNRVAVAEVTVPLAPPLKETMLLAAVVEKPKPLIVKEVALAGRFEMSGVTTGMTVAT